MLIRVETSADHDAIRQVNGLAFGNEAEGRLIEQLRRGGHVQVSLVAEENGQVVGHILFTDLPIHTLSGIVDSLALAPMAVVPPG